MILTKFFDIDDPNTILKKYTQDLLMSHNDELICNDRVYKYVKTIIDCDSDTRFIYVKFTILYSEYLFNIEQENKRKFKNKI